MKIVFLMQDIGAVYGAEQATLDLAEGIRRQGADIRIWLIEEARLMNRSVDGENSVPLDSGRDAANSLRDALDARHIPWASFPVKHALSFSLVRMIRNRLVSDAVSVLHCVGYKADVHGGWAARFGRVVPCVSTVHGWLYRPDIKEIFYGWINVQALRRFQQVVVLSRYYEGILSDRGVQRLIRIPTGIPDPPLPEAVPTEGRRRPPAPLRIGMLGRLSSEKNHDLFLRAARKLIDRGTEAEFRIAGTGPERAAIQKRIDQWGLNGYVNLSGYVDSSDFMRDIDVLVLCSRMENLPYVILEAMRASRPVVATRVGGIPDLVEDGITGYLVAPYHADQLADRIEKISNDPDLAYGMGLAGRKKLECEFSRERAIKAHIELYEELRDG